MTQPSIAQRRTPPRRWGRKTRVAAAATLATFAIVTLEPARAAATYRAKKAERQRIVDMAANLGLDPQALLDPDAYQKRLDKQAEVRREMNLALMRMRTDLDPGAIAKKRALDAMVEDIEDAYALHGVAALADDVGDLRHALDGMDRGTADGRSVIALERASFRHQKGALDRLDRAIGKKLAGLPAAARIRHKRFLRRARADLGTLARDLARATDGGVTRPARLRALRPTMKRIAPVPAPRLPRAPAEVEQPVIPAAFVLVPEGAAAPVAASAPLRMAPGVSRAVTAMAASGPPTADDLAPTVDAPFSPAILAKAAELGNDPVRIFNFVHDRVANEVYRGSRKGAAGALAELSGNDVDQASLLIALLRAAGVHARYELVRLRLTEGQAHNYTGVDTAQQAASMLTTANVPARVEFRQLTAGGAFVPHVVVRVMAVRAHVPYADYRGITTGHPGVAGWVPLVPSIKDYDVQTPVDLRAGAAFDFDAYLGGLTSDSPREAWEQQLRDYILAEGLECETLAKAQPLRTIVPENLPYLRSEYPAVHLETLGETVDLSADQREFVELTLRTPRGAQLFTVDLPLAQLYAKRISLTYEPATADDQQILDTFGGIEHTPLYLIELAATLRIDGVVAATGAPQAPGIDNRLDVTWKHGSVPFATVPHTARVGSLHIWHPDRGLVPRDHIDRLQDALASAPDDSDEADLARLQLIAARYFRDHGEMRHLATGVFQSRYLIGGSNGLFTYELTTTDVGGAPLSGTIETVLLDVSGTTTPFDIAGDDTHRAHQKLLIGHHGSALEHIAPGAFHGPNIYSSVRLIQEANAAGVTVYDVPAEDVEATLPLLAVSADVKQVIRDRALPGRRLRLPQTTHAAAQLGPVYGFISVAPETGAAHYTIGTGREGSRGPRDAPDEGRGYGACSCEQLRLAANSTVLGGSGAYFDWELDLSLPRGPNSIDFKRTYHSAHAQRPTSLGYGWRHVFDTRVTVTATVAVLHRLSGDWPLSKTAAGSYSSRRMRAILSEENAHYLLRFAGGPTWSFDERGRLVEIEHPDGTTLTLERHPDTGVLLRVVADNQNTIFQLEHDQDRRVVAVRDRAGRTTTYAYDERGRLATVTRPDRSTLSYTYDSANRLVAKAGPTGAVSTNAYDTAGRWLRGTGPSGYTRRAAYDTTRSRVAYTDGIGATTTYGIGARGETRWRIDTLGDRTDYDYDADLNLTTIQRQGVVATFDYDSTGNLVREVSPGGSASRYEYDAAGRLLRAVAAESTLSLNTRFEYTQGGKLASFTNTSGETTTYAYDPGGRITAVTGPGGATHTLDYDADGNLTDYIDPTGVRTRFTHGPAGFVRTIEKPGRGITIFDLDAMGRPIVATTPSGPYVFERDEAGRVVRTTDPLGRVSEQSFDERGLPIRWIDHQGEITTAAHDGAGNLIRLADRNGTLSRDLDALGRLRTLRSPDGRTREQRYCASDLAPCEIVTATGHRQWTERDVDGFITRTVSSRGANTSFVRDERGLPISELRDDGGIVTRTFDEAGRLTSVSDVLGPLAQYEYDARGNLTAVVDAIGARSEFEYDLAGRRTDAGFPDGERWQWQYDGATGQLAREVRPDGREVSFTYDSYGRLTHKQTPDNRNFTFEYDTVGRLRREAGPDGVFSFEYDNFDRPVALIDERRTPARRMTIAYGQFGLPARISGLPGVPDRTFTRDSTGKLLRASFGGDEYTFGYDYAGRRSQIRFPNGITRRVHFDEAGRVGSLTLNRGSTVVGSVVYTRDRAGRISHVAFDGTDHETYEYDVRSRLQAVTFSDGSRREYSYDLRGNRTAQRSLERHDDGPCSSVSDRDCDGVADILDICPTIPNPKQLNSDGDVRAEDFSRPLVGFSAHDEFADGASAWHVSSGSVTSGVALGSGAGTTHAGTLLVSDRGTWDAAVIQATITSGPTDGGVGVVFGFDAPDRYYRYHSNRSGGFERIERISGDTATTLAERSGAAPTNQRIRIVLNGPAISVERGASTVLYAEDANLRSGRVGFYAWRAAAARFDDLMITPLDPRGDACDPCPHEENAACTRPCDDADGDGYGSYPSSCGQTRADCATDDESVNPGALESCDGVDNDCDGVADEVCSVSTTLYRYSPGGRLLSAEGAVSSSFSYDAQGNRTSYATDDRTLSLEYDSSNRLIRVTGTDGLDNRFGYMANGQRIMVTDSSGTRHFSLFGSTLIAAYDPDGTTQHWWDNVPGEHGVSFSERSPVDALHLHGDLLGSVRATTTPDGLLSATYAYDTFGSPRGTDTASFGFTGRPAASRDLPTLLYNGHRYLDTETGTWNRPDPLEHADGPNRYSYVHQDPVNHVDPTGTYTRVVGGLDSFRIGILTHPELLRSLALAGFFGSLALAGAVRQTSQTRTWQRTSVDIAPITPPITDETDPICPDTPEDDDTDRDDDPDYETFFRGMQENYAKQWIRAQEVPNSLFVDQAKRVLAGTGPSRGVGLYMTRIRDVAEDWADRLAALRAQAGNPTVHTVISLHIPSWVWQAIDDPSLGVLDDVPWIGMNLYSHRPETFIPADIVRTHVNPFLVIAPTSYTTLGF